MCGRELTKRRRVYCSGECALLYWDLFFWNAAKCEAIERAHHKCQRCGVSERGLAKIYSHWYQISILEVHHIRPLNGRARTWNKLNIPSNLLALCHECHVLVHSQKGLAEFRRSRSQIALRM